MMKNIKEKNEEEIKYFYSLDGRITKETRGD